jgi:hypothetical protein
VAGAHAAIERLLLEQAGALVEAVISKYVMLSREELQEWREEPEVGCLAVVAGGCWRVLGAGC